MKLFKKSVAYVLSFVTVFSSFTILPSGFSNMADVSAVELTTEASTVVETNQNEITLEEPTTLETNKDEITLEEPTTVETNNNEIAVEKTIAVENNKAELPVATSNAVETATEEPTQEKTYTEGDFTYSIINDNEVELVSYNSTNIEVAIPDVTTGSECSELANKKVTAIGNNAFKEKVLESVTFGKNIVTIGDYAFYKNKVLTKVDLSVCTGLTTIGKYAFCTNSALVTLELPNSLQKIDTNAFNSCNALTALETGTNLTKIGDGAFANCERLNTVNIKGGNNAVIGLGAFQKCVRMKSLTIGDGIKTISKSAFKGCKVLKNITLGKDITTIGDYAFSDNTAVMKIDMSVCTALTSIGNYAFSNADWLISLQFPKSLKIIGDYAFSCNSELTAVDMSVCTGLTSMGSNAFENNIALKTLKLPKSLKTIGDYAFSNNKAMTTVDMSACTALTTIGVSAFERNAALTSLMLPDNLETIGDNAFRSCRSLKELETGSKLKRIGKNAFNECSRLKTVNIKGGNNATIAFQAFYNCHMLVDLNIGAGVKTIEKYAFIYCYALKNMTIGSDCTFINPLAFYRCNSLDNIIVSADNPKYSAVDGILFNKDKTAIIRFPKTYGSAYTIPNTVVKIEDYAFAFCVHLTGVTMSNSVQTIGNYAFDSCTKLTEVTIGDDVKTIGDYAFKGCSQFSKVKLGKNITSIGNYAFSEMSELTDIDLSICTQLETVGNYAFYNCDNLGEVKLRSHKLTGIGECAFRDCDGISTVDISYGNNATIGKAAFQSCHYLGILNISNGITIIDEYAFYNCSVLQKIYIGNSITTIRAKAFDDYNTNSVVQIFGTELMNLATGSIPNNKYYNIYCYQYSTTHKTLKNTGYTNLKFFAEDICPKNITVNGVSAENFTPENREYTVWLEDISNVEVVPVFEDANVKYTVTAENNIYTISIFDENDIFNGSYKITVKQKEPDVKYTVIGDVTLTLDKISATKVSGNIALPKGTYRLKLALENVEFGYSKRVKDTCSVTLSEKYKGFITLDTTGGTYTFQFDKNTKKLVIKHDSNLPNEYLIGDIDTILKPVGDRPLSIGTQQLPKGTYKFKLSIGGKKYGYNKVVDDATAGSLSVNSKYSAQITLNATGGIYTFTLNTETNKLIIRHTPTVNECTTDVHISGTFNLVLNDKSATGEDSNIATGTTYLEDGCYTFKVYNYGVAYTAGAILNDSGIRTLSSKYTTPITLNATGGTYKFVFDKETGLFEVSLLA